MRTQVGYVGGRTQNPTYHDLADHAEGVELRFDPMVTGYEDLLELFWESHDPTRPKGSTQYRAAVFCSDEAEAEVARASRDRRSQHLGSSIETEILVGHPFYPAEAYHQKWRLRRDQLIFEDLSECFPTEAAVLTSAAAAKLNGIVAGQVPRARVEELVDRLGLSDHARSHLLKSARDG